jgi:hypothetical protein
MYMTELDKFIKVPILIYYPDVEEELADKMQVYVRLKIMYIYSYEAAIPSHLPMKPENLLYTLIKMDDGQEYVAVLTIKEFEAKLGAIECK